MDSMGFDSSGCFKDRFSFLPIVESVHTTVLGFGVPSGFLSFPVRCARSRPVTRGGARGAFAPPPPPTGPKGPHFDTQYRS